MLITCIIWIIYLYIYYSEFKSQPPHFPTLDDFVAYINNLKKKGAAMNPYYTQRHLGEMFTDYQELDVGRSSDPLGAFINRYAVKLGFRNLGSFNGFCFFLYEMEHQILIHLPNTMRWAIYDVKRHRAVYDWM